MIIEVVYIIKVVVLTLICVNEIKCGIQKRDK